MNADPARNLQWSPPEFEFSTASQQERNVMSYSDQSYNLRIELDTKQCELSRAQIARMEDALEPLSRLTKSFPVSDLYVTVIHHSRPGDYHVKTSLILPGRTLFTGERHREVYPAYEQCIDKLVRKVTAYKAKLGRDGEQSKVEQGTRQEIVATQNPDREAIEQAVENYDYAAFRELTAMFEEPVRKRAGRWVQRYPEIDALIGEKIEMADIVEDVFLTAFERFTLRPSNVPFGEWLEELIDDVIRAIASHPDEELENIKMAQSAVEAETRRESPRETARE
jgi:ribosome-associated translation inhibitor RaiA